MSSWLLSLQNYNHSQNTQWNKRKRKGTHVNKQAQINSGDGCTERTSVQEQRIVHWVDAVSLNIKCEQVHSKKDQHNIA